MIAIKQFNGLGWWALPLSLFYGLGVWCHRLIYRLKVLPVYQAPKPVIAIGNIAVGGTGKTPMTVWVARQLIKQGKKPGIILRGYKALDGISDEATMLNELLAGVPLVTGANRQRSIELMLAQKNVDVIICDDAFQHWPLGRNLDVVLIDATRPFGNGLLLPAGILREPLSALKRAQMIVITKSDDEKPSLAIKEKILLVNPKAIVVRSRHQFKGVRDLVTGKDVQVEPQQKIIAVAAIADPTSFYRTLTVAGFKIVKGIALADHAPFTSAIIKNINQQAKELAVNVVAVTHKDAVKIKPLLSELSGITVISVDIELDVFEGQEKLYQQLKVVAGD